MNESSCFRWKGLKTIVLKSEIFASYLIDSDQGRLSFPENEISFEEFRGKFCKILFICDTISNYVVIYKKKVFHIIF